MGSSHSWRRRVRVRAVHEHDADGFVPLHCAILRNESLPVVQFLAREVTQDVPHPLPAGFARRARGVLHVAAVCPSREMVKWIASEDRSCALTIPDDSGWLPLHIAVQYAKLEVVQLLALECPGALEERTHDGWLPVAPRCSFRHVGGRPVAPHRVPTGSGREDELWATPSSPRCLPRFSRSCSVPCRRVPTSAAREGGGRIPPAAQRRRLGRRATGRRVHAGEVESRGDRCSPGRSRCRITGSADKKDRMELGPTYILHNKIEHTAAAAQNSCNTRFICSILGGGALTLRMIEFGIGDK
jgi:Ankyrin repeats (3 copies)